MASEEVLANETHADSSGSDVLLGSSIDKAVFVPVDFSCAEVGTHISAQNLTFRNNFIWELVHGETLNSFVAAVMEIFGILSDIPFRVVSKSCVFVLFIASYFIRLAIFSSFLDSSCRPGSSGQVVTCCVGVVDRVLAKEVVANSRELHRSTSLEKVNLEVIRDI